MVLLVGALFIILFGYQIVKFLEVLLKMNQTPTFPNQSEVEAVRKHPDRKLAPPTYKDQKWGIIIFSLILLFWVGMFIIGIIDRNDTWTLSLLLFIPFMYSHDLLNMFAIYDDGLLAGNRFIPWKNIQSFEFKPIDIHHKYYGHSKEINDTGYELLIKQRVFSESVIVMDDEMKERLTDILSEHTRLKEDKAVL